MLLSSASSSNGLILLTAGTSHMTCDPVNSDLQQRAYISADSPPDTLSAVSMQPEYTTSREPHYFRTMSSRLF